MVKCPQRTNAGGIGPVKYQLRHLPQGWQQTIIDMAAQGCCEYEIRAAIKIRENTKCLSEAAWKRFLEEEDEFYEVVEQAEIVYQAFWRKQGRVNLTNKDFQTGLYIQNMVNRLDWKSNNNKHEHSGIDGKSINVAVVPQKMAVDEWLQEYQDKE